MKHFVNRRNFVLGSAAALSLGAIARTASTQPAAALKAPVVDSLVVQIVTDSSYDTPRAMSHKLVKVRRKGFTAAPNTKTLHSEWGLAMTLESRIGTDTRYLMLDYGYTPEALVNNIEFIGVDTSKIQGLIMSHGHFDHFGGLMAFLQKHRDALPADVKLYAGGEDNFCHRMSGAPGQFSDFGTLDRRELAGFKVTPVLGEKPMVIEGHAFTTGKIARNSIERVLPNSHVEFGIKDGLGCNAAQYVSADMVGKSVPDQHLHEHATCFNVKGKGLVVISSCGHAGIVNSVRQAQEVSGIEKVHAIVGGFHLGPAPKDYLTQVVGEIKKLKPDVLIPMHCSGLNFVQEARAQMPENVLVTTTGSRITFGA